MSPRMTWSVHPTLRLMQSGVSGYRRELVNMSWLVIDRLLRILGNFAIGIAAARLLGPADFGAFSYTQTVAAFLALFVTLGFNGVVVKRLVDRPEEAATTLGSAVVGQAAATIVVIVATLAVALGIVADRNAVLVAIVACGLALRPTEIVRYWFEANVNARRAVIADNSAFVASGAIKVGVLVYFRTVEALAWTLVVEQVLSGICLIIAYRTDRLRPLQWHVDLRVLRQLVSDAWPLLLSGLAVALYMRIDQVIIMAARGSAETGLYSAAVRVSEIAYVLPAVVATSFFPRWQALMGEPERHRLAVQSTMTVLVMASAAIALALSLGAGPLVRQIYGESYVQAAPVLAVHAWTCVFVSMGILGNQWYLSHGLQRRTLLCTVLGASSNLAINLLLVPRMGAVGAAVANLSAQVISTFAADAFSAKTRPLFLLKAQALLWPLACFRSRQTCNPSPGSGRE